MSGRCSAPCAMARWAAPSSTRSATSRCCPRRRSTTCRTSSSRPTRRGRAGESSIAASSCSATTYGDSPRVSRCSTWSTRRRATDRSSRGSAPAGTIGAMQIAIVGLAGSGKTTVFNTLTRGHAETGGYGGVTLNVGVVKVPDERLDRLAEIFKPKKIVQDDVTYVDLPAPPASSEGRVGTEELPADHL